MSNKGICLSVHSPDNGICEKNCIMPALCPIGNCIIKKIK